VRSDEKHKHSFYDSLMLGSSPPSSEVLLLARGTSAVPPPTPGIAIYVVAALTGGARS
jgi:hypothetical protein